MIRAALDLLDSLLKPIIQSEHEDLRDFGDIAQEQYVRPLFENMKLQQERFQRRS